MNIAIVLASGLGKRMRAGKNKTLLNLGKNPLIYYALDKFEKTKIINKVVIVVREGEENIFKEIIKKYNFKKVVAVIAGGEERQDSAWEGLKFIKEKFGKFKKMIVVFHNGANPFVTREEIEKVVLNASRFGASVVAHKTKDTIRQVDKNMFSLGVVDRINLWNMQTPQAIGFGLALRAFLEAKEGGFYGTDDVSLVEKLGKRVKIIEASENNFKITTPLDLKLAEIIVKNLKK